MVEVRRRRAGEDAVEVIREVQRRVHTLAPARRAAEVVRLGVRAAVVRRDERLADELRGSLKDRAEHVMLVDLSRNDLSRVCTPGTVTVSQFMEVESFSHILHLVSHVEGSVAEGRSSLDVLKSAFPAGTLSGAPKPRALQLLDEWEAARAELLHLQDLEQEFAVRLVESYEWDDIIASVQTNDDVVFMGMNKR